MDISKISVVILSGGKSSRMGQDKALLKINGMSFVEHLAKTFSKADEILFSVRTSDDFPEIPLRHIADDYPGCGPLAGIQSALKHARNPWVFIIACDTPLIDQKTLELMLGFCEKETEAIIPKEENGRLHVLCGLYHRSMLEKIEKYLNEGDYRVRRIFQPERTTFLSVSEYFEDTNVFRNVNTPEDYKEMKI